MAEKRLRIIVEEILKGTGTADAARHLDDLERNAKRAAQTLDSTESKTRAVAGGLTKWIGGVAAAWVSVQTAQKAYETVLAGSAILGQQAQFENLAASIGTTADMLETRLKSATGGLFSDAQQIAAASEIISLGLASNENGVVRLANAAARLNLDMQVLGLTLANDSTARLDSLGLSMQRVKEISAELKAEGFTGDAFDEAVLIALEERMNLLGDASETTAGKIQIFNAKIANLTDGFKIALAEGVTPFIDELENADFEGIAVRIANLGVGLAQYATLTTVTSDVKQLAKQFNDLTGDLRLTAEVAGQLAQIDFWRDQDDYARDIGRNTEAVERLGIALQLLALGVPENEIVAFTESLRANGTTAEDVENAVYRMQVAYANGNRITLETALAHEQASKFVEDFGFALDDTTAAVDTATAAASTGAGAIDGWAQATRKAGDDAVIATQKITQLYDVLGAGGINSVVKRGLARFGVQTKKDFKTLEEQLNSFAGEVGDLTEKGTNNFTGGYGRATRQVSADYARLSDTIQQTADEIVNIENARADRIAEINKQSATREATIRKQLADSWADYYARRSAAAAQFTREQSNEFLGILGNIERGSVPTFDALIDQYAKAEAAAGSTAGTLRDLLDGFKDTEQLSQAAQIQSYTDALQALADSDLKTDEKKEAIKLLQQQFAEGETANLESFGVQILNANQLAEKATADRLAAVEALEETSNDKIRDLHIETADRIADAHKTAETRISATMERLGDTLDRELGKGEIAAMGVRDQLQHVKDLATDLNGRTIDIILNYVTNGSPPAPPAPGGNTSNSNGGGLFMRGGYTGAGAPGQVAGIVHRDEFVIPSNIRRAGINAVAGHILENDPLFSNAAIAPTPAPLTAAYAPAGGNARNQSVTVNQNINGHGAAILAVTEIKRAARARDYSKMGVG